MTHSIDELMLQRCVDGELTDHERAELLSQLDQQGSLDSWKTLALSFVEHQVFAKVFAVETSHDELKSFQLSRPGTTQHFPEQVPVGQTSGQRPARSHWMHRPVRPWFSIAASLLVGMIVGVGGHFMMNSSSDLELQLANDDPNWLPQVMSAQLARSGPSSTADSTKTHQPVMNVHLTGMGTSGGRPVAVPVYLPEQWQSLQQQEQRQQTSELPEEVRDMLEAQGMRVDHQHHWYRARLNDGREILVPTETMRVRHTIQ